MDVLIGTFNVGGIKSLPPADLDALLDPEVIREPHVIALSLQECTGEVSQQFADRLTGYTVVTNAELRHQSGDVISTRLVVFARSEVSAEIIDEQAIKAFNGGVGARNKGGIVLHLRLNETYHVAFVGAHLAAHRKYNAERLKDLQVILPYVPEAASTIFIFGDLNFRLNFFGRYEENDYSLTRILDDESEERRSVKGKDHLEAERSEIEGLLADGKYEEIVETYDQLRQALRDFGDLDDFSEARPINFPPTYKYSSPGDFDSNRLPAYPDRILYKSRVPIELASFTSLPKVTCSDHRPVMASFKVSPL